ncbi:MAG: S9 family peptidase [Actinobacteria bacterium]|nr:S9 family peptidase [Actinomycetota bacterium]
MHPSAESLLSARLFLNPEVAGEHLYFASDLSGRMSLYRMRRGGSVPEPLIPGGIALANPKLINGELFSVFPDLDRILVMIDEDGNENYQPHIIPLAGGIPEPMLGDRFTDQQVNLIQSRRNHHLAVFSVDPRVSPKHGSYVADLSTGDLLDLGTSVYGNYVAGFNDDLTSVALIDSYSAADTVLYLWEKTTGQRRLLAGTPIEQRAADDAVLPTGFDVCFFRGDRGILTETTLFSDRGGCGWIPLEEGGEVLPVTIGGTIHEGAGEFTTLEHLDGDRFLIGYNIDGCSWAYEATFDESALHLEAGTVLWGEGPLHDGVAAHSSYDRDQDVFAVAFSTATSPVQLFTVEGRERNVVPHTNERILGLSSELLSAGEDASYASHDGLHISARLYLPPETLGFVGPRPIAYYIHGGPQSQERPDFTWFSMPLIQYLSLRGFAVFVPNVRGSKGYGLSYMKQVDRDWGGKDLLDHVAAIEHLKNDARVDTSRMGVLGRSYGGYMTLELAGRHPRLWSAAIDMFGPYDLITFVESLPETWKTYFHMAIGHPERDHDFLVERSPKTYLGDLACPMLVIQGRNDPRVVVGESNQLVHDLRAQGKEIEYLVFDDEGHDMVKRENKLRAYEAIADFLTKHLRPQDSAE